MSVANRKPAKVLLNRDRIDAAIRNAHAIGPVFSVPAPRDHVHNLRKNWYANRKART